MTNPQVESLLEHDSFLRALARSLLGDGAEADDVVQQAWLVALKSAKRPHEVRRGWLAGIVKNLVRRSRRDVERRARRERIAARGGEVVATDEACAEDALRRRIAEIVVELPMLYREPLLLRYYDGLTPQAIAERLALPGSTVRTRIQRGLAQLRSRLECGNGDRRALSLALLAIAARRPARRVAVAGIAAAVALVAVLSAAPPPGPLRLAHEARATAPGAIFPDVRGGDGATSTDTRSPPPPATDPVLLEGIVHLPPGARATAVRLEACGVPVGGFLSAEIAGDAPFALDVSRVALGAMLRVRALHPESEPAEALVRPPCRVEMRLRRRALVPEEMVADEAAAEGEAQGAAGEDASADGPSASARRGASISLEGIVRLPHGASAEPAIVEVTRPDGATARASVRHGARFSIGVAALLVDPRPASLRLRATHPDAAPYDKGVAVLFDPATGAPVLPFVEIDLEAAGFLEGVVELEGFGPAPDLTVAIFEREGEVPTEGVVAATTTGADGRYRVTVARDRSYYVAAAAPGYAPAGARASAAAPVGDLLLPRGVEIGGRVRSGGEPDQGAVARASLAGGSARPLMGDLVYDAGHVVWGSVRAETGDAGEFVIRGLETQAYRLEVEAHGMREVVAPATVDFDDAVAQVAVVVRGGGLPVAGATVEVRREAGPGLSRVTDAEGRAAFPALPGESLLIAALAPGLVREERKVAAADGLEVVFDLDAAKRLATLAVALRADRPLPSVCIFDLLPGNGGAPVRRTAAVQENRFLLTDLEPGPYSVVALPGGTFLPARADASLASGETVQIALDVRAGGYLVVRFLLPGPMPDVWLEGATGAASAWTVVADALHSGLLAQGPYVLHILGPEPVSLPAEVMPGETVTIVVGPR